MVLKNTTARIALSAIAILSLTLGLAGCDSTSNARFIPDGTAARSALEKALTAWRDGQPYGPIEGTPSIQIADSRRQKGEAISAFEVTAEKPGDDGTHEFTVRLTPTKKAGTPQPQEVRYMIHGRDPVWIYSEADYKRMVDMGNGAPAANPAGTGSRRVAR
jgi:hypothetical protein